MKPKISVIIPIYNTEQYLEKCLDSVVRQSLKDIEILCIDDLSPDESSKIVEKYAQHDSRVKLITHKKNLGQGGARNTGIMAAKADYIASIDSDDAMHPKALQTLWEASESGRFDVVCCGFVRVDENNNEIARREFPKKVVENTDHNINIFKTMNPAIWNKLWRKELFIKNKIFFPQQLYYQDMATIPLLLTQASNIKFIEDCLYNYLVRDGSVTTTYSPKHILDYFKVYEILYSSLERLGLLERYSSDLFSYVSEGLKFHANNVIDSDMNDHEKDQYLRHMLMLKVSFLQLHEKLIGIKRADILMLINTATTTETVLSHGLAKEMLETSPVYMPKGNELTAFQTYGVSCFAFVFGKYILPKQKQKLKNQPQDFFEDSKNAFTKFVGKLLRII